MTSNNIYISQMQSIAFPNKYTKWYCNIILTALLRTNITGYFETHHIIPKCFKLGGEYDKDNLAKLTAKEHYIIHLILTKMFDGKRAHQMILAFTQMSTSKTTQRNYKISSILYSAAKEQQSAYMKTNNHNASGEYSKAAWAVATPERRNAQSKLRADLNRKLKTKPKEFREYNCSYCNKLILKEEFCHHQPKKHYFCNMSCTNKHTALTRVSTKGITSLAKSHIAWNKGLKSPNTSGENNPAKRPESRAKLKAAATGRKQHILDDGSWKWKYQDENGWFIKNDKTKIYVG